MKKHLNEGGAAGHMAHPFDLPRIKNGMGLLKFFQDAQKVLNDAVVKIDGANLSIKIVGEGDNKQFALDRGSTMQIDIDGVTTDKLKDRFPDKIDRITGKQKEHGMVKAGTLMLDMLNTALPSIKKELIALGLYDDPTRFLNTEFVSKKTNVQEYDDNFLAIHGVNQFYEKTNSRTGTSRPGLDKPEGVKAPSAEVEYEKDMQSVIDSMAKKISKISSKFDFKVYTKVPAFAKEDTSISFEDSLNSDLSIRLFSDEDPKTQKLGQWLKDAQNPKGKNIVFKDKRKNEALNKETYIKVLNGESLDTFLEPERNNLFTAVDGVVIYHATKLLGQDILNGLTSEMGDMTRHEGIVLRNSKIANVPVKITGDFILKGMQTSFRESLNENEETFHFERKVAIYPGKFKPPHIGHLYMVEQSIKLNGAQKVVVMVSSGSKRLENGIIIGADTAKKIFELYLKKAGLDEKTEVIIAPVRSPVEAVYNVLEGKVSQFKAEEGDLIIPVASDKPDPKTDLPDWTRFNNFEYYCDANECEENVYAAPMKDFVIPALGDISATNFRSAIENGKSIMPWIPNNVTEEEVLNLINSEQVKENKSYESLYSLVEKALEESYMKKAKKRLKDTYKRLTKTGRKDLTKFGAPYNQEPNYTKSNAFLAKEEQDLEEISSMAGGSVEGYSAPLGTVSRSKDKKKTNYKKKRNKK